MVDEAAIAQGGVDSAEGIGHGAGDGKDIAPGVVGVFDDGCSRGIQNGSHVTLQVHRIEVVGAIVDEGHRNPGGIIGEIRGVAADDHLTQLITVVDIGVGGGTVGSPGAYTISVIGIRPGCAAIGHGSKLPNMKPTDL